MLNLIFYQTIKPSIVIKRLVLFQVNVLFWTINQFLRCLTIITNIQQLPITLVTIWYLVFRLENKYCMLILIYLMSAFYRKNRGILYIKDIRLIYLKVPHNLEKAQIWTVWYSCIMKTHQLQFILFGVIKTQMKLQ